MKKAAANAERERRSEDPPLDTRTLKEKVLYWLLIAFVVLSLSLPSFYITGWEMSATKVIQTTFGWSIQWSALLVGGIAFTPAISGAVTSKLAYRFKDRQLLVFWSGLQALSSVMLFDYGSPAVYLIGSLIFFNGRASLHTSLIRSLALS